MSGEPNPLTVPEGIASVDQAQARSSLRGREVIIITGMSGAGRSRAAAVLEDLNWYVVDNLPAQLLQHLVQIVAVPQSFRDAVAAVIDVRSGESFEALDAALDQLSTLGVQHRIIFLDADDPTLVRRFDDVRRPHPLQHDGRLVDAISRERDLLRQLRHRADFVIDTSQTSVHELAKQVRAAVTGRENKELTVTVMSFGFKHGIPLDADHVADVRFVANPYWVTELRHLTGHHGPVKEYVLSRPGVSEFLGHYLAALEVALHGYVEQEKRHLTIAFGCTGGRHRSVTISEHVAAHIKNLGHRVQVIARDVDKE